MLRLIPLLKIAGYNELTAEAVVVERDGHGDKVLRLKDGRYLKLFRRKRILSSALWAPYALRFKANCAALKNLNVPCPTVDEVGHVSEISRDVVIYQPLPGDTIRQLLAKKIDTPIGSELPGFIARLHGQGIYFRSLHLGNIVVTPTGSFGLIDVADMRFYPRALPKYLRERNIKHLLRDPQDADFLRPLFSR